MTSDLDAFVRQTSPFRMSAKRLNGAALAAPKYDEEDMLLTSDVELEMERALFRRLKIAAGTAVIIFACLVATASFKAIDLMRDGAAADRFHLAVK